MKQFITKLITKTGQELLKEFYLFSRDQARYKSKYQIVTKADLLAEKIIISAIKKKYPTHEILSEEAGKNNKKSDYLWIIDPLDGTTNFTLKIPLFGVNIALAYKGEIIIGAIYIPILDKLFYAEKNKGATMNNKKIKVSNQKTLTNSFLAFCHGSELKQIKRSIEIYKGLKIKYADTRQMGSAAAETAWVAVGYLDAYFVPGANSWDVAAGALIVREAGGKVTDFAGKDWNLKSKDLVASNGKIHKQLLREINKFDI